MCTTSSRRLCAFTVALRVEFQNNASLAGGAFATMINGWETATESMWNGSHGHQHFGCCAVSFEVITRVGSGTANFHQINVVAGPQTSFVNRLGPGCTGGRWDAQDTGNVIAHESGHLLSLPDEYDYNGPGNSYRNLNPQPAGQPQSIMAQTWANVAALQSHVDAIMNGLGATCPWWCCLIRPLHWLTDVLRLVLPLPLLVKAPVQLPAEEERMVEDGDRSIEDTIEAVRDGSPASMSAAVRILGAAGPKAADAIEQAARDEHPVVRWVAVAAADEIGQEEILTAALDDPDLRIRVTAAGALARRNRRDGIQALVDGLTSNQVAIGHPPELVADVAEQALEKLARESLSRPGDSPEARAERWRRWAAQSGE
ncbi:MAG: hypothetical protein KY462_16345 [Actinobacteria bacterium]|nr:hypothetical protein [Actinomycetota bacterium]